MDTEVPKDASVQNTIFDDVFRTIAEKMPILFIAAVNYIFGTNYPYTEEIVQLRNEHHVFDKIHVTDCYFMIRGRTFHIECQNMNDNTMGRRICCSYFYARAILKRRKSRDIPGTSANQTRRLPLTADQLFHRIRKGLPDVACSLGRLWKQLSVHDTMIPHPLAMLFFAKIEDDGIKFLFCCQKKKQN